MTEHARLIPPFEPVGSVATTPTGMQSAGELRTRRLLVLSVNLFTYVCLVAAAAQVLAAGGWTVVDGVMFVCFLIATPWTVLGFWNAVIGLWLLHGRRGGLRDV